jgi:hypothetical protein
MISFPLMAGTVEPIERSPPNRQQPAEVNGHIAPVRKIAPAQGSLKAKADHVPERGVGALLLGGLDRHVRLRLLAG